MAGASRWCGRAGAAACLVTAAAALACGPRGTGRAPAATEPSDATPGVARAVSQPWRQIGHDGWQYLRRGSSIDDDIVQDATAPVSAPEVLRIVFTPDMGRDREPSVHWISLPDVRDVYARWWIKLSPNWSPSPAGGGKIAFLHAAPSGMGQVYTSLHGSAAPHRMVINTEWAPYGQKIWEPNVTRTPIVYGRWYRMEWHMKWPPRGSQSGGTLRCWVDDVLNGEYRDVTFPAGGSGFHQFEFAPTLQNPPRAVQYMFIDHTHINAY